MGTVLRREKLFFFAQQNYLDRAKQNPYAANLFVLINMQMNNEALSSFFLDCFFLYVKLPFEVLASQGRFTSSLIIATSVRSIFYRLVLQP